MKYLFPLSHKMQLSVIFLAYVISALIFGFAYRFAMNPDGTSMLRLAGYLSNGNFMQSISAGYSPLFIWLVSIFMAIGFDGQSGARITIALCGSGLLIVSWFLTLRFDLPQNFRFIAVLIAAPLTALWTIQFISPDVLFAALTLCYIWLITDPDMLNKKSAAIYCGIAGGFLYLTHQYALPFFLIHFPLLLLTKGYMDKEGAAFPWKRVLLSWVSGIAVFLIIVAAWISIVSAKYGHLTIGAKGGPAHSIMGPTDIDRRQPFFVGGLFKPRDDYAIYVFEDPSEVEFKTWSPFESKEYFIHQLKVIIRNAVHILNHFVTKSPFFTYPFVIGILVFIPLALFLNPLNKEKKFLYSWIIVTFSIYCSGFLLLIAKSPRRFYSLMIVFLFLSFHFMEELKNSLGDIISDPKKRILVYYLLIILVSAFTIKPGIQLLKSAKYLITHQQVSPYQEMAKQINSVEFPAPYAVIRSSQKLTTDYYIAYFLRKQLLGRPRSGDIEGITQELRAADARSLLVFDNPEIVKQFKMDKRYDHIASLRFENTKRYESTVNINVLYHEIITGWDDEVNIFTLK